MSNLKEATKKTWWYRLYAWIREVFRPPCTWKEINAEEEEDGTR